MTQALTPDGHDAFIEIAKRLDAAHKPVQSVLTIAEQLPAGESFITFALALEFAMNMYTRYLEHDLKATEERKSMFERAANHEAGPVSH